MEMASKLDAKSLQRAVARVCCSSFTTDGKVILQSGVYFVDQALRRQSTHLPTKGKCLQARSLPGRS